MARRFTARVRGDHLVLDEPVSLPDGSVVEVEAAGGLECGELAGETLDAALRAAAEQFESGETTSAPSVLRRLRRGAPPPKRYRIELAAQAVEHAVQIQWSSATTPVTAPSLFLLELEAALRMLEIAPHLGHCLGRGVPELKCLQMPLGLHRLYYDALERRALVRVYAIWPCEVTASVPARGRSRRAADAAERAGPPGARTRRSAA